jgi:glycosyltransferase involved in cell wall biosynthesis
LPTLKNQSSKDKNSSNQNQRTRNNKQRTTNKEQGTKNKEQQTKNKTNLKKILIISYFYPPANFVGAERIASWVKYLPEQEIYPIVVTRIWEKDQKDLVKIENAEGTIVEKLHSAEIHRVSEKPIYRDTLLKKDRAPFLRKMLSFIQLLCDNFVFTKSSYYPFFKEAKTILGQNPDIQHIVISGTPFHSFAIGYHLKRIFPNINWFPDYRDQWTTHPYANSNGLLSSLLYQIEKKNERKWTSNCKNFITVSENWKDNISAFIHKEGYVVKNGFDFEIEKIQSKSIPQKTGRLIISYIGTLYPYQNIEDFIEVIQELILSKGLEIQLNFVGCEVLPKQKARIEKLTKAIAQHVHILSRMPKNELQEIYQESDLLLVTRFEKMKGWYPVKLFDYAANGAPIILFPSDKDVMEEFVLKTNTGVIISEKKKLTDYLSDLFFSKERKTFEVNYNELAIYSRSSQVEFLKKVF